MITYDEFVEKYKPITNPFVSDSDYSDDDNFRFAETGEEWEYVRDFYEQSIENTYKIFTQIEDADNNPVLVSGYHLFDRYGYFITQVPYTDYEEVDYS